VKQNAMKSTANISREIRLIFTITALWLKATMHTNNTLHKIYDWNKYNLT